MTYQVLINLITNSIKYGRENGKTVVGFYDLDKNILIEVSDTGKGIPPSKLKTVFEPGYTTKKRGWGLGLSLVKRIVEEHHGGKIFVKQSELGKRTTFKVVL